MSRMVRSYRAVYRVERRVWYIPLGVNHKWPLPVGIPLVSIGYAVATAFAMLVLSAIPGFGEVFGLFANWQTRYIVAPVLAGFAAYRWRPGGLLLHRWALVWLRAKHEPRRTVGRHAAAGDGTVRVVEW